MTDDEELTLTSRHAEGESVKYIASSMRIAIQTVYDVLKRQGKSIARQKSVAATKMIRASRGGATVKEIAVRFDVSISTVQRVIRTARVRGEDVSTKRGRPNSAKVPYALTIRRVVTGEVDSAQVDTVYQAIYRTPFPYPESISRITIDQDIKRLRSLQMTIVDGVIRPWSHIGVRICVPFFPNRYEASKKNTPSALHAWRDERLMKRAIAFQLKHGDPVTPKRVLRAVALLCRTPTVFRPAITRFICERYCPTGGKIWDPCSGFGGRLLGAHAAGMHYIGTDVETETIDGNRQLAEALGASHELFVTPAEDFTPPAVDLVFTSPPYFDRERYSQSKNQSWKKYNSLDAWVSGFLYPIMMKAHRSLSTGRYLILNVANFKERGATIPIIDRTIAAATSLGFVHVETLLMPLASVNRRNPTEPILVFQS